MKRLFLKAVAFTLVLFLSGSVFIPGASAATDGNFTLDYNVLEKFVEFPYGEIEAGFALPANYTSADGTKYQYRWPDSANAAGLLYMNNTSPDVYGRYCISDPCPCIYDGYGNVIGTDCNLPTCGCIEKGLIWKDTATHLFVEEPKGSNDYELSINENSATVVLNPMIYARIKRDKVIGDKSAQSIYHSDGTWTYTSIGEITVNTEEAINRPYQRVVKEVIGYEADRKPIYSDSPKITNIVSSPRKAYFSTKPSNQKDIIVKVYNGKPVLPEKPVPEARIENNNSANTTKSIWWASAGLAIPRDKIFRMMYTQNAVGDLYKPVKVSGKYDRSFVAQNKADLSWCIAKNDAMATELSMANGYKADREKSKQRDYRADDEQKAVFASDVSYRDVPFPIRSGYFFNPVGNYTFTITTELYRTAPEATPEHKHLVNELIRSFRYESNMVYIHPRSRQAVGIDNVAVTSSGPAFNAAKAYVSVSGSNTQLEQEEFLSGNELVQIKVNRNYTLLKTETLTNGTPDQASDTAYSADIAVGVTDLRLQAVLEGYTASGTKDSRTDYRYTEYIRSDVGIYKVTETTTVMITVNPANRRLYTHAMLSNGNYYVRAYTADMGLGRFRNYTDPAYQLNALQNASTRLSGCLLDLIKIKVVGSIFDDQR